MKYLLVLTLVHYFFICTSAQKCPQGYYLYVIPKSGCKKWQLNVRHSRKNTYNSVPYGKTYVGCPNNRYWSINIKGDWGSQYLSKGEIHLYFGCLAPIKIRIDRDVGHFGWVGAHVCGWESMPPLEGCDGRQCDTQYFIIKLVRFTAENGKCKRYNYPLKVRACNNMHNIATCGDKTASGYGKWYASDSDFLYKKWKQGNWKRTIKIVSKKSKDMMYSTPWYDENAPAMESTTHEE